MNPPDVGTEVFYRYDTPEPTQTVPANASAIRWLGRLTAVEDRGAHTRFAYDGRGRTVSVQRQIAKPGLPAADPSARYAPHWFERTTSYDNIDRVTSASTGVDADLDLRDPVSKESVVSVAYSTGGALAAATSSYGTLIQRTTYDLDGVTRTRTWGDLAGTTETFDYLLKPYGRALTHVQVSRGAPTLWSGPSTPTYTPPSASAGEPSLQKVLEDAFFDYDAVGNPRLIQDNRDASDAQWPGGAKPVNREIAYDDLYRVTSVASKAVTPSQTDGRRAPPPGYPATERPNRVTSQTFGYDAFGDITSSDDDSHTFFDRSLGTSTFANQRLTHASSTNGSLDATYDAAGNLVRLDVQRVGPCVGANTSCTQSFRYAWDEVGQLARAQRFDTFPPPGTPVLSLTRAASSFIGGVISDPDPQPTVTLNADISYAYDGTGSRVLRTYADGTATAEIFASLRLNHTTFDGNDYRRANDTEAAYLEAGGVSFGRLVYSKSAPSPSGNARHVFFELGDHLGSTGIVIDRETSELVERSSYTSTGAEDSDYAPSRWGAFREEARFTGKENDDDVGITYFGARYYSASLGRWISPDPQAIHALAADLNPYAYVGGQLHSAVDPYGWDPDVADGTSISAASIPPGATLVDTGPMGLNYTGPSRSKPADVPAAAPPVAPAQAPPEPPPNSDMTLAERIQEDFDRAWNVAGEALHGFAEGTTPGGSVVALIEPPAQTPQENIARAVGQGAGGLVSAAEGLPKAIGGTFVTATGAGAPVGAPVAAWGGIQVANGVMAMTAATQLLQKVAAGHGGSGRSPYNRSNFRSNLIKRTGVNPADKQAHHVLPQKFEDQFRKLGLDIHDPKYGAWWDSVEHAKYSSAYNNAWETYLARNPSATEVLDYAKSLARIYGYQVGF